MTRETHQSLVSEYQHLPSYLVSHLAGHGLLASSKPNTLAKINYPLDSTLREDDKAPIVRLLEHNGHPFDIAVKGIFSKLVPAI